MYKIISRKYRPQKFLEVVGQAVVVRIIQNSLKLNKIGQAYLFSGPRGVGKTTLARIIGKVVNCNQIKSYEPCGKCKNCFDVLHNASLDYHEIDGASNRGIDQIRDIQSNLQYASPQGNYRIYVIDEVHMLTLEAFNALLKSLEEPPIKVIFILCTTEINKIPLTIRSRCQNFLFKNLTINEIALHLKNICIQEKVDFEEGVFLSIARRGDGSVRDAENLLEQIILYCDGRLTLAETNRILGEIPLENKLNFFKNLYINKLDENKFLFDSIIQSGIEVGSFLFSLLETATNLVFLKHLSIKDNNLTNLPLNEGEVTEYRELLNYFSHQEILLITDILHEFISETNNTKYLDAIVGYYIIKLHRYKRLITPEAIRDNLLALSKSTQSMKEVINPNTINQADNPDKVQVEKTEKRIFFSINENFFQAILSHLNRTNIISYRYWITFKFASFNEETKTLALYDAHNNFNENYLEQKSFLLKVINDFLKKNGYQSINQISIKENMIKSSVKKIKKYFPDGNE